VLGVALGWLLPTFLATLIDHSGTLHVQYLGVRFDSEALLRDLQALLREWQSRPDGGRGAQGRAGGTEVLR
jgi:hypothetical protein